LLNALLQIIIKNPQALLVLALGLFAQERSHGLISAPHLFNAKTISNWSICKRKIKSQMPITGRDQGLSKDLLKGFDKSFCLRL
jgi:hypothetical protein